MSQTPRKHRNPPLGFPTEPKAEPKDRHPVLNVSIALCKIRENLDFPGKKHLSRFIPRMSLKIHNRRFYETQEYQENPANFM